MDQRRRLSNFILFPLSLVAFAIMACGGGGGGDEPKNAPPPANRAPSVREVSIDPAKPLPADIVRATAKVADPDGNLKETRFRWYLNGNLIALETVPVSGGAADPTSRLSWSALSGGDTIKCEAIVYDTGSLSGNGSASVTVAVPPPPANRSPSVQGLTLNPAKPKIGDPILAVAQVADPDGNLKEARFKWSLNGKVIAEQSVAVSGASGAPISQLPPRAWITGDEIRCDATVSDAGGLSASTYATAFVIGPIVHYRADAVCFSPYLPGQSPAKRTKISEQQIRDLLAVLAPYTKAIRIFGMLDGLENIPRIAKTEFGLDVIAGIWLDADIPTNEEGFANLVKAVNAGYVKIAVLGNEVLLFNYINPSDPADNKSKLIGYIKRLRAETNGLAPVTTVDTYDVLLDNPDVMAVCDHLYVNIYPFWEGIAADKAAAHAYRAILEVQAKSGGKPVVVAETGWPSAGLTLGDAVASPENAVNYNLNFVSMARSEQVPYCLFEFIDEAWKTENGAGPHWGIWGSDLVMKTGMSRIFNGETWPDNWSCDAPVGGPGTPAMELDAIPVYGDTDGIVRGRALHVIPSAHKLTAYINAGTDAAPQWWVKPYTNTPTVAIACDGSFAIDTVTGGIDHLASEIRLYLVPVAYATPNQSFLPEPPPELAANAVVVVSIRRDTGGGIQVSTLKP